MKSLLPLLLLAASATAAETWPMPRWNQVAPSEVGMDESLLRQARDYALTGEGSGYVTRHGKLVMTWGDPRQKYDLKSTSKSIGVTALGLALMDGKLRLEDKAAAIHPQFGVPPESNRETGWLGEITIFHLATQTAGFAKHGGYQPLLFRPGTAWHYSDSGPNWLAECVTLVYRRDVRDLMFERVFTPIGIQQPDLSWRNNSYRPHEIDGIPRREFGSGVSANVDAMARIGYLYLRRGRWQDKQILPETFIDTARTSIPQLAGLREHEDPNHGNASEHYGLLWWNNADGSLPDVPRDAYWSWGLYDSLIVVIPSLNIVASRAGKSWDRKEEAAHYDVLAPFLTPIAHAAR
jgi:CubicO group peptidase (beta-lactamase class C family)